MRNMNIIKRDFNLRALQPNIKTLELHHIIVEGNSFRCVEFNEEPTSEESKHYCVIDGTPFHLFGHNLVYPLSYKIYDNLPFSKITNAIDLTSALQNYSGNGVDKYARYFDNSELNQIAEKMNLTIDVIQLDQDGMVYKIERNGVYALINDTMVYISKEGKYQQVSLGDAQKSTL